ncbi:MAG TPA: GNAT family N-acetyltransferase [Myxococcota bacterium]
MPIRPFRKEDAGALVALSMQCARGEADFVLNPLWESEDELFAEFGRFGIDPGEHLLVADAGDGEVLGLAGFIRETGAEAAGMFCPIVRRNQRGKGLGGELLRQAIALGSKRLGIGFAAAGIGTRNRAGYSLLTSHGFRPVRQHFLMRCERARLSSEAAPADLALEAAEQGDADAILDLYSTCGFGERSRERMQAVLGDGRHAHGVARAEGRVVAFVELETHWPRRVWVAYVGVAPPMRARGLGSALTAWALGRQFEAGAESALLMLSPVNRTAVRAYEKAGFRRHRLVDVLEKNL